MTSTTAVLQHASTIATIASSPGELSPEAQGSALGLTSDMMGAVVGANTGLEGGTVASVGSSLSNLLVTDMFDASSPPAPTAAAAAAGRRRATLATPAPTAAPSVTCAPTSSPARRHARWLRALSPAARAIRARRLGDNASAAADDDAALAADDDPACAGAAEACGGFDNSAGATVVATVANVQAAQGTNQYAGTAAATIDAENLQGGTERATPANVGGGARAVAGATVGLPRALAGEVDGLSGAGAVSTDMASFGVNPYLSCVPTTTTPPRARAARDRMVSARAPA